MYGWDLECCILTLCLPSWCTMLINVLALTFWWPQWARRQWCGVDCFVPPAVKTVARGSTPLGCEPGKPFCLWNGSLESSNVTAGRCDILTPASWRTVLKKKPNVFNIDNLGQDGGQGREPWKTSLILALWGSCGHLWKRQAGRREGPRYAWGSVSLVLAMRLGPVAPH